MHPRNRSLRWLLGGLIATGSVALAPSVLAINAATGEANISSIAGIEPKAGTWKTWLATSGADIRPAAPPDKTATDQEMKELVKLAAQRDAKALAQIAYWDAGSPSYRWQDIALAQVVKTGTPPHRAARLMALMNVAIYDAMVAAWDAKYAFNRPRPSQLDPKLSIAVALPNSPSYPSEHAVAAGAASAVLGYVYPEDAKAFDEIAEQAGQARIWAGVHYPSDVTAGFALGRAVAAKVIARAKSDGSDAKWTGTVPKGPGIWNGEKPAEPQVAAWKPWVLKSANQFRPPAPPAYDSAQKLAELAEIKAFTRTFNSNARALYYQSAEGSYFIWNDTAHKRIFEHHLETNPPRAARVYALMSVARNEAVIACWDAKYAYWAIRPSQLDKTVTVLFPPPNHPSYPAGHGCNSAAGAQVLAYLFPDEAKFIQDKADEAGMSRMWAGIHYRSDIEAGLKLGRQVADLVIEWAKADGAG